MLVLTVFDRTLKTPKAEPPAAMTRETVTRQRSSLRAYVALIARVYSGRHIDCAFQNARRFRPCAFGMDFRVLGAEE